MALNERKGIVHDEGWKGATFYGRYQTIIIIYYYMSCLHIPILTPIIVLLQGRYSTRQIHKEHAHLIIFKMIHSCQATLYAVFPFKFIVIK